MMDYYRMHDGELITITDDTPPEVPKMVTRFQARGALLQSGFLAEVETIMSHADTDAMAKLAWTDAQEFYRQSPTILGMAAVIGLTDQELDDLFILAATIQA